MQAFVELLSESVLHAGSDLETVVRPLLELMEAVTGLESTYVTAIDRDAGIQRVLYARNTREMAIPEGLSVPWDETLCKRAIDESRSYTDDVAATWPDVEAARQLGIASFSSTPIRIDGGQLYGTLCAASLQRQPIREGADRIIAMVSALIAQQVERDQLLRQLQRANDALARTALIDTVTGLPNRRALMEDLQRRYQQVARDGNRVLAAFVDLDGFKAINDHHGHDAGDRLLRAIGEALVHAMRGGDFTARMGGDEFVVLASVPADDLPGSMRAMAERLQAATTRRFALGPGLEIDYAGPSIGIVVGERDACDGEALIQAADAAMYAAKRTRRGTPGPS